MRRSIFHRVGNCSGRRSIAGSALIVVTILMCVLCLVAGTLLSYTSAKQSAPFTAASWHEAGAAAEGGVEIALNALRRSINEGTSAWDGWAVNTPTPGGSPTPTPSTTPFAKKYLTQGDLLSHDGEGNNAVRAIVEISLPTGDGTINPTSVSSNRYAYLIRSTGIANLPASVRVALDNSDMDLRKLNFFKDWRTNTSVPSGTKQVSRVVEAIASPVTPFPAAIMAKDTIEIKGGSNMIVDSYDVTQFPYKYDSTKAFGDVSQPGNKRTNGNICTNAKKNDNTDVIRLENVKVYGIAAKGNGVVNIHSPNASVSGEIIDGFYRELKPVADPSTIAGFSGLTASTIADRPTTHHLTGTVTVAAGKGATGNAGPLTSYYKFSKIHLHTGEKLEITAGTAGVNNQNGVAEIWVTGDIIIHNGGLIQVDNGARAIFYCARNITLQEKDGGHPAVDNNAMMNKNGLTYSNATNMPDPSALQFYGVVPDHHGKHVKIKSDMAGVIYAPDHDFEVNLKAPNPVRGVYGALTGRKFQIKGSSQVHYDEALGDVGKPFDYTLESWQEDWFDPQVRTLH